jgi:hypothetical protein
MIRRLNPARANTGLGNSARQAATQMHADQKDACKGRLNRHWASSSPSAAQALLLISVHLRFDFLPVA